MRFLSLSCVCAGAFVVSAVHGEQWEVELGLEDSVIPSRGLEYTGRLEYFFSDISAQGNVPWDEAAFVGRIASVSFDMSYDRQKNINEFAIRTTKSYDFKVDSIIRGQNSAHYIRLGFDYYYARTDFESEIPELASRNGTSDYDRKEGRIAYGYYLDDSWTIEAEVGVDLLGGGYSGSDQYNARLSTNRLWSLGGERWIGVELGASIDDLENDTISETYGSDVSIRFYPNRRTKFEVGASTEWTDIRFGDLAYGYDGLSYHLGFSRDMSDALYIGADVFRTELEYDFGNLENDPGPSEVSEDGFRVKMGLRF